jgi:hypothetical protein
MAQNFQPLLTSAAPHSHVVVVAGGGTEGHIITEDLQGLKIPLRSIRGHSVSIISLSLDYLAKEAPEVSFIHDYPGSVRTALFDRGGPWITQVVKFVLWLGERWLCVPIEECGERHAFLATSPRCPSASEGRHGKLEGDTLRGSDGKLGSGAYSIGWDGESSPKKVERLLEKYRDDGTGEAVWRHTLDVFAKATAT